MTSLLKQSQTLGSHRTLNCPNIRTGSRIMRSCVKYARTSPSTSNAKIIGVPIAAIISWTKSKTPSGSIRARCLISYLSLGRNQTTRTQLVLKICLKSPMIPFNGYNLWVSHKRKIHHLSHGQAWSEDLHRNPELSLPGSTTRDIPSRTSMSTQATPLPPSEGTAQIARSPKYFEYLGNPVTGSNLSNEQVDEAKILMKALQPSPGTSLRPLSLGVLVFLEYIVTRAAQPVPRKLLTLTYKAFKICNYHGAIAVKAKVWDEQKAFYGGLIQEIQSRMRAKEQSSWRNFEAQLISQITALNKQWTAYLKQVFESADKSIFETPQRGQSAAYPYERGVEYTLGGQCSNQSIGELRGDRGRHRRNADDHNTCPHVLKCHGLDDQRHDSEFLSKDT